ncbi:MAG: 4Fe-4S dicluster domain-containing protein, partial [Gemmatimonadetes bacterium]|nr:4Fe-4S dicluster domain-containing protein [Gemmatimonadota bacterium]NIR79165.1 4Fe-4S dicluster domain-containing protein [Gemmatimonadota bacterium]NIT87820.1 4Fe-4S dicluster domain-containing protein [Gemmatimonadota bacterium]NIU31681.1 4Fe-4S dicluster domain-containing protein [Gemmatimonadota bacterium]NIV62035.1 4Fe-4S dicluster domain-containing protein [Gemmatimonadota bacterium]
AALPGPQARSAVAEATRTVQWNVDGWMVGLMYASMAVALVVCAYGVWRRVRIWRLGRPVDRFDRPWRRLERTLVDALGQASVMDRPLPGLMHGLMYGGFLALFAATVVVFVHHDLGLPIMRGRFYLYFQSLFVNLAGALAMVGVGIAAARRYLARPPELERREPADGLILLIFFLILATGFVVSGARIEATGDTWGTWRPVSRLTGTAIAAVVPGPEGLRAVHASTWVVHVLLWHAALAAAPFTKLFHVLSSTLSVYFSEQGAPSTIPTLDFDAVDETASLGIGAPSDMTWKQLLELDACTECGRCEAVCPAWAEGKPLSPKRVILDLRDHVRAHADELLAAKGRAAGEGRAVEGSAATAEGPRAGNEPPCLAGDVIRPETIWACTTCRACEEACPVGIEHVPLIVGLRRHLSMEQARAPDGVADLVSGLESRGHPFRGASSSRVDWFRTSAGDPDRGERS